MRKQIYISISNIYFNFKKANKINVTPLNQDRLSSVFSAILFPTKQPPKIAIIFTISENIIIWIKLAATKPAPKPAANPSSESANANENDSFGDKVSEWSTSAAVLSIYTFKKNLKSETLNS